jgi:hypothetical protein
MHELSKHQKNRDLISICRREIDGNAIQGFVLASSEVLVVIQYVFDFNLDGLMVLRTNDVSEVRCTATDKFQRGLLLQEGLKQRVPFDASFDLRNWRSVISQLSNDNALAILECEGGKEKDFLIGQIVKTTATAVQIRHFSGAANWAERPKELKFKDLTCCRVGSNYAAVYQRHFERLAAQA